MTGPQARVTAHVMIWGSAGNPAGSPPYISDLMKTLYKVIGFGENQYGFFNQKAVSSTVGYACGIYNGMLWDSDYTGAVIIRQDHESWQVILEFGTEGMSIECGPLMTFSVKKAPALEMV